MIIEREMEGPDWPAYVSCVASAQGYALEAEQEARVVAQMRLLAEVARPLLALQLAVEVEPAPVFRP